MVGDHGGRLVEIFPPFSVRWYGFPRAVRYFFALYIVLCTYKVIGDFRPWAINNRIGVERKMERRGNTLYATVGDTG